MCQHFNSWRPMKKRSYGVWQRLIFYPFLQRAERIYPISLKEQWMFPMQIYLQKLNTLNELSKNWRGFQIGFSGMDENLKKLHWIDRFQFLAATLKKFKLQPRNSLKFRYSVMPLNWWRSYHPKCLVRNTFFFGIWFPYLQRELSARNIQPAFC